MRILGSLLIAGRLGGQETEVIFCPAWDTRWTATDTLQFLALLGVTVAIMVAWRMFDARFRGSVRPAVHRRLWRRWRRWLPTGMALAGGLLIVAGQRGFLDGTIGNASAIAWAMLNLPAMIVVGVAADFLGEPLWPLLFVTAAMVWLQWYAVLDRVEAVMRQPRFLSLSRNDADSPNGSSDCLPRD